MQLGEVVAVDHSWQRAVRRVLARHPDGLSLSEVADEVGLSRANTWHALDELSRAGAVREYRRRSAEGRTRHVSLWRLREQWQVS
ncbi:helix-turn-helix domain-containing protein [Allosaccharopolyspora coralli]|uniref:Helix-turn-helix domain-containing protein n=1 Tax=Allosaccharopolyspora coralli TaxID=2665642 RepID=A0A5Q3Q753_9PSEU|nr:helix-turn-helix domain-containing protein [Allosaccharopolyspora coralli]QGK70448.1 helix-turn-helix domain-containing protein [Allosaccharopolyspora coralli]